MTGEREGMREAEQGKHSLRERRKREKGRSKAVEKEWQFKWDIYREGITGKRGGMGVEKGKGRTS